MRDKTPLERKIDDHLFKRTKECEKLLLEHTGTPGIEWVHAKLSEILAMKLLIAEHRLRQRCVGEEQPPTEGQ
jgi:hypothetical protein